jgi:hypothetical protein
MKSHRVAVTSSTSDGGIEIMTLAIAITLMDSKAHEHIAGSTFHPVPHTNGSVFRVN